MILFQKKQQFAGQKFFCKPKEEECILTQKEALHKIAISKQCHQPIKPSQNLDLNLFEILEKNTMICTLDCLLIFRINSFLIILFILFIALYESY